MYGAGRMGLLHFVALRPYRNVNGMQIRQNMEIQRLSFEQFLAHMHRQARAQERLRSCKSANIARGEWLSPKKGKSRGERKSKKGLQASKRARENRRIVPVSLPVFKREKNGDIS
jgi:hypothetical protein